jgi:two-component system sensor histidine kinase ChvG
VPLSQLQRDPLDPNAWPEVSERVEVRAALAGAPAARTRRRDRDPGVFLFVAEPIRNEGKVVGAVYAARSTRPVMVELYRIRSGLIRVLVVAFCVTALITVLLSWSISRPLRRLSRAAKRVAAGEPLVVIPVGGGGEIAELGESFAAMKERLDARLRYISDFSADVAHSSNRRSPPSAAPPSCSARAPPTTRSPAPASSATSSWTWRASTASSPGSSS